MTQVTAIGVLFCIGLTVGGFAIPVRYDGHIRTSTIMLVIAVIFALPLLVKLWTVALLGGEP